MHAEELLAIAKELRINLSDTDLVLTIGRQFEIPIQRTIRMQGIKTFGNLYDLLQDYDNQDADQRAQAKANDSDNNSNNDHKKPWWRKNDKKLDHNEGQNEIQEVQEKNSASTPLNNGKNSNNFSRGGGGNRSFQKNYRPAPKDSNHNNGSNYGQGQQNCVQNKDRRSNLGVCNIEVSEPNEDLSAPPPKNPNQED